MRLSVFFAASLTSNALAAIGPIATLPIVNRYLAPDGFNRSTVVAGGTFPGPLITGKKGDRFKLNVTVDLTDSTMLRATSIHWHGLLQKKSSWADGPAGVTQCPITPGNSFLYEFESPEAGTYWYHSHLSTQYCDGLRGAFVVYDPFDPHLSRYDIDNEDTVITLADWYHVVAPSAGIAPRAVATLVNGLGRWPSDPTAPLAIINVESGKRYRFRLVSTSCDPFFTFSIANHAMTIIEADGTSTLPLTVDSIDIFAGQRYSFVLIANKPVDNYWIRALPNLGPPGFEKGVNSAILRYRGAPIAEPTTASTPSLTPLVEQNLRPLTSQVVPGNPRPGGTDVALNLVTAFSGATRTFTVNGATFHPPPLPVLLQILSGARSAQDLLPPGSVYTLPANKAIELTLPGGSAGSPHPFHLHGHVFEVIRSAGSTATNYINPIRRDVVSTGFTGDNVTIRFNTDNAGPWILHCHIDWHLEIGLAVVFAEDVGEIAKSEHPAAWDKLCPKYDEFVAGGGA